MPAIRRLHSALWNQAVVCLVEKGGSFTLLPPGEHLVGEALATCAWSLYAPGPSVARVELGTPSSAIAAVSRTRTYERRIKSVSGAGVVPSQPRLSRSVVPLMAVKKQSWIR